MTRLEMVREALARLGEAPAGEIAAFVRRQYGVALDARMVPVVRASLRELDMLSRFRQEARTLVEQAKKVDQSGAT